MNYHALIQNWPLALPELLVLGLAILILIIDAVALRADKRALGYLSVLGLAGIIALLCLRWPDPNASLPTLSEAYKVNALSQLFKLIFLIAALLVSLASVHFAVKETRHPGEYMALLLFSTLGLMVMVSACDLITLYLGIELGTLSLYALAAFRKDHRRSSEAGLKYLLLAAISSAVMIYGISLLYGSAGSTQFEDLAGVELRNEAVALLGMILLVTGFAFKCAAAPFHMWAPDVYEGAPTPITGFISVASKAAGFAVLLRVLVGVGPLAGLDMQWQPLIKALAALSIIVGNLLALQQSNIKRMLAYSGIAQAGYLLIAVAAGSSKGVGAVAAYLFLYMFTNLGAFFIVHVVASQAGDEEIRSYTGLAQRAPLLALGMLILLLSLGGIPPLAGFVGKFYLFWAGIEKSMWWLVLLGALFSVISLYYYLMVIRRMYILEEVADPRPLEIAPPLGLAIVVTVAMTLLIGIWPSVIFPTALKVAHLLFP